MNSHSLLTKFLTKEQKKNILIELVEELNLENVEKDSKKIQTLSELLKNEEFFEFKESLFFQIKEYCLRCLKKFEFLQDEEFENEEMDLIMENLIILCELFQSLYNSLIVNISSKLIDFLVNKKEFPMKITENSLANQYFSIANGNNCSKIELIKYLQTLEKLLSKNIEISQESSKTLNVLLCTYLNIKDEEISTISGKIFRWTINNMINDRSLDELVILTIANLVEQDTIEFQKNGFKFWIRYLNDDNYEILKKSKNFQIFLKTKQYWDIIQKMLVDSSHEVRKFGLSVLQSSVQLIVESFDNGIMKWDINDSINYIKEWKRFCVLYEITGIDTSLHQLQAGTKDIQSLLDPQTSKISSSWGLCLISTGLQASMESVRKYSLEIILTLPINNLELFNKSSVFFLKNIFLSFAFQGSMYSLQRDLTNINRPEFCPFGEKLSCFITNVIKVLIKSGYKEDVSIIVKAFLERLTSEKTAFDFAKVYIVKGLHVGLKGFKNILNEEHLNLLESLFQTSNENDLLEIFLQKLYFRLILGIDAKKISLRKLINTISKFILFNNGKHNIDNFGYVLLDDETDFILDFIITNYPKDELLKILNENINKFDSVEEIVILLHFIVSNDSDNLDKLEIIILKHDIFPMILTELTFSNLDQFTFLFEKLQPYYLKLASELSNNLIKHKGIWKYAFTILKIFDKTDENLWIENINLKKLWISLTVEFQNPSPEVVELAADKLKFFESSYKNMKFVVEEDENDKEIWGLKSFDELAKMANYIYKKLNSTSTDYKTKDEAFQAYFGIMKEFLSVQLITDEIKSKLFTVINNCLTKIRWKGKLGLIKLLKQVFVNGEINDLVTLNDIDQIKDICFEIWEDVVQDKLKLNQQKLHLELIELIFSSPVLLACETKSKISDSVIKVGIEIINESFGRRRLIPRIASKIQEFQLNYPNSFNNNETLAPLLIKIVTFIRLKHSGFTLLPLITKLYDQVINYGSGNLYEKNYGLSEQGSRIKIFVSLASLNKNSKLGKSIIDHIFESADERYHLFVPKKRIDGGEEWTRVQLYSIILIISNGVDISNYVTNYGLTKEASPIVRAYLEWIISLNYLKHINSFKYLLEQLEFNDKLQPAIIMSYQRIAFLTIKQCELSKETEYLKKFLSIMMGYCSSDRAALRHFSASLMCCIKKEIEEKPELKITNDEKHTIDMIYKQVTMNGKVDEYRNGDAMLWDVKKDLTLVGICGGVLLKVSDRINIDFIPLKEFKNALTVQEISRLKIPLGNDETDIWLGNRKLKNKFIDIPVNNTTTSFDEIALQKKSGAWRSLKDPDYDIKAGNEKGLISNIKRSELIVVGSLVDKIPNLGGICRLCDVLGAGILTLGDANYAKNPQFKNVAVTADLWLPMIEVIPSDIIKFMKEKKSQGYTLIGLEQTDKSVELNYGLKFPKKSLIVLGKEKEGVPGDILAELDFCVEIKQVGVVRSMNIQTATALIVHAYSLQYC